MLFRKMLMSAGLAVTVMGSTATLAHAHGPNAAYNAQPCGWHQGWHLGPGMMGQGHMPMMGHGQGPMMGQGMMGQGMMGQGMGRGMMQPLRQDLSAGDVKHMMEHRLTWMGNPNIKVGKVEEKDDDTIVAEIVTQDGSIVQSLEVDRHTGWMRPGQ